MLPPSPARRDWRQEPQGGAACQCPGGQMVGVCKGPWKRVSDCSRGFQGAAKDAGLSAGSQQWV